MTLDLTLHIWRQKDGASPGALVTYKCDGVDEHASFLEMLDILNERLIAKGEEPIAFDNDCREGICGMCSLMINGRAHGGFRGTATCQLHMRHFKSGDHIYIEPWRAGAFPVIKDLVVDRSAFDRVMTAGGYITMNAGSAPEANSIPVSKEAADRAMDAASCIACGACVAACPNGSAMLFVAAKLAHLHNLPQGDAERDYRTHAMVSAMDAAGFGNCSNHYECEAACPKEIPRDVMAKMNRDYTRATFVHRERVNKADGAG